MAGQAGDSEVLRGSGMGGVDPYVKGLLLTVVRYRCVDGDVSWYHTNACANLIVEVWSRTRTTREDFNR
jgi:hypothetical protein